MTSCKESSEKGKSERAKGPEARRVANRGLGDGRGLGEDCLRQRRPGAGSRDGAAPDSGAGKESGKQHRNETAVAPVWEIHDGHAGRRESNAPWRGQTPPRTSPPGNLVSRVLAGTIRGDA